MLMCLFHFAREAAGASGTRLSLRPLFFMRVKFMHHPGADHAAGMPTYASRLFDIRIGKLFA